MPKIWSTADVQPRDRLPYWIDAVCDSLVHADCEVSRDRPFFGEMRTEALDDLRIVALAGTVRRVTRSPRQIARDPTDSFAVTVNQSGVNLFNQDGRDAVLRRGDLVLHDMTRPLQISVDSDFAQTVLLFPRSALKSRLGAAEPYIGRRIDGATGMGRLLSPLLRALPAPLDGIPTAARERVAGNVLDLIATALLPLSEAPSAGMTLVRVKLWIETHLGEALTAERISGACRMSVRHLNRLFRREGTSLMHHVWERRLALCHRDLTDPAMRNRSIIDIAFAAGFNDLSHFSRAYRARYGCPASELRRD